MPREERFGLPLGTKSDAAADVAAIALRRSADAGAEALFERVLGATPDFAPAHIAGA